MRRNDPGRRMRYTRRLALLDLVAHGTAVLSCATGGIILESIILLAAASHHLASMGFRLFINEREGNQSRFIAENATRAAIQLALWTGCLLLAIFVTSRGAHSLFHTEHLNAAAMAGFALPGLVAIATTTTLRSWSTGRNSIRGMADTLLSAAPTVIALVIAFVESGAAAGRLDAIAGLAIVMLLCVRTVMYLGLLLD